jgi:hypothetical protein
MITDNTAVLHAGVQQVASSTGNQPMLMPLNSAGLNQYFFTQCLEISNVVEVLEYVE